MDCANVVTDYANSNLINVVMDYAKVVMDYANSNLINVVMDYSWGSLSACPPCRNQARLTANDG